MAMALHSLSSNPNPNPNLDSGLGLGSQLRFHSLFFSCQTKHNRRKSKPYLLLHTRGGERYVRLPEPSASIGTSKWMDMEVMQRNVASKEEEEEEKGGKGGEEEEIRRKRGGGEKNVDLTHEELGLGIPTVSGSSSSSVDRKEEVLNRGMTLPEEALQGRYGREIDVAVRAVQLSCYLTQQVQERILRKEENAGSKTDRSLVTVADWGVQAVISWVLSASFKNEEVNLIAEEDSNALKGMDGIHMLQRVVDTVNECLNSCAIVGLNPPSHPLASVDVLKAINKGSLIGGPKGRYWVLDPVDGTLGFVRCDQYAVALSLIEDGEVVLGVLGCPNLPMRKDWLRYHHKYYRFLSKMSAPVRANVWDKGCVFMAQKGKGSWMQPLIWNVSNPEMMKLVRRVSVSSIEDPSEATFCEPVEKANSSQSITAGLASSIGLKKQPLRVYSMAKYGAIARGDVEIFMKFARSGYKEKIWDHAAGVIIVEEAGGVVTDAGGKPLDFSQGRYLENLDRGIIVCSGKALHSILIEAVDASWNSSRL